MKIKLFAALLIATLLLTTAGFSSEPRESQEQLFLKHLLEQGYSVEVLATGSILTPSQDGDGPLPDPVIQRGWLIVVESDLAEFRGFGETIEAAVWNLIRQMAAEALE